MKKVKRNKARLDKFQVLVLIKNTAKSRLLLITYLSLEAVAKWDYLLPQPEVAYVT